MRNDPKKKVALVGLLLLAGLGSTPASAAQGRQPICRPLPSGGYKLLILPPQAHLPGDCVVNDGIDCTVDRCDAELGCVHEPDSDSCGDGDACTDDSCDPLEGCVYTPVHCDDGDACTDDGCDPTTGCTSTPTNCDDGDACTDDSCDSSAGCVHTPLNCDDGDPCNGTEVCVDGTCLVEGNVTIYEIKIEDLLVEGYFVCGPPEVQAYAPSLTGSTWGFRWNDTRSISATIESVTLEVSAGLNCNLATRPASLNGVGAGDLPLPPRCSGCETPSEVVTYDLTPYAGNYILGGTNTFEATMNFPNFEGIRWNPAWGPGDVYARIIVQTSGAICDDGDACTDDSCDPVAGCVNTPVECDDGDPCNGAEVCVDGECVAENVITETYDIRIGDLLVAGHAVCGPPEVQAYAPSLTGNTWGFRWDDAFSNTATIHCVTLEVSAGLNCNTPARPASLNGVGAGDLPMPPRCSGCETPSEVVTYDLTPYAGNYILGGTNTFEAIMNWVNFEGIRWNPAWGSGDVYARVIVQATP